MKREKTKFSITCIAGLAMFFLAMSVFVNPQTAYSDDPTLDEQVADAVAGGQAFLFNNFVDGGDTGYYWSGDFDDYYELSATAAAVSALIETGKYSDSAPLYQAQIDKAFAYILAQQQGDGSFGSGSDTYQTGMALVALALYHSVNPQDETFITDVIQPAVDYFLNGQRANGSWGYSACGECGGDGDLSNTQFAIMGLFYAYQYILGEPIPTDELSWAGKLETWVRSTQNANGCFTYTSSGSSFVAGPMNGAGLWALAMLGVDQTDPAVVDSLGWLNDEYVWSSTPGYSVGSLHAYYYGIYAMAKGLTGMIPSTYQFAAAANDWVTDLKQAMVDKKTVDGETYFWNGNGSLDPGEVISTAFVLMSLSFADPATESPTKRFPDTVAPDYPINGQGFVTLEAEDGVTISFGQRRNIDQVDLGNIVLPIGAFDFTLNNVPVGGTAVLKIIPPPAAFDRLNIDSFVNDDGTIKAGLDWYKFDNGTWQGVGSVPIRAMPVGGPYTYIEVTLQNGGPEDTDGDANNTTIVDPAAPGAAGGGVASNSSCFINSLLN